MGSNNAEDHVFGTRVLPVTTTDLGHFENQDTLEKWILPTAGLESLEEAASHLKHTSIPVGFPTETVYGLGADATRSDAVTGIYKAKGRPSDNPLIIHVCDLTMLGSLLSSPSPGHSSAVDPVPEIYKPLIKAFWPGPLTILLPNPEPSKLAPEVTAGLSSFGLRMPSSPLALSLIQLAGVPLAAPSANASTKPSPTTAQHVLHDLDGTIEIILDGGPCQVGVESTVVDGLCDPPVVLRPGGVSIDRIRECKGWGDVVKGYKDASEVGNQAPRAPGMKYKHYSPKAKVVLFEASPQSPSILGIPTEAWKIMSALAKKTDHMGYESMEKTPLIGIVSTRHWPVTGGFEGVKWGWDNEEGVTKIIRRRPLDASSNLQMKRGEFWRGVSFPESGELPSDTDVHIADIVTVSLGNETKDIAHGLFSALRELDQRGVDVIYVEGIEDEGDIAAAVMNRLRKAASIIERVHT
ncbi:Threonylcarbamoyl-AMP synthase [Hyphodiscus hymeniophilus]|uniref:Threonylcarbamoyl-AMP synthase n=1 Tax=Hyphodiscus hymeniophilus TaxID=353542 RepID=A0A9P7AZA7_9HELO|nr:Threonylcarbamoyl-AMP synthase [Hyphodiscus hymeniophilus]